METPSSLWFRYTAETAFDVDKRAFGMLMHRVKGGIKRRVPLTGFKQWLVLENRAALSTLHYRPQQAAARQYFYHETPSSSSRAFEGVERSYSYLVSSLLKPVNSPFLKNVWIRAIQQFPKKK